VAEAGQQNSQMPSAGGVGLGEHLGFWQTAQMESSMAYVRLVIAPVHQMSPEMHLRASEAHRRLDEACPRHTRGCRRLSKAHPRLSEAHLRPPDSSHLWDEVPLDIRHRSAQCRRLGSTRPPSKGAEVAARHQNLPSRSFTLCSWLTIRI